jgi:cytochrome P450 family 110
MLKLISNPTGFLDDCAARYGDSFTLRVLGPGSPPVVFLSNPESVQAVFTTLAGRFEFGKVTQVFRPLVGSASLIMQQGSQHQQRRKLLMPALHQEKLQAQGQLICDLVRDRTSTWPIGGEPLLMRQEIAEVSLAVILQVVFGLVPGDRYDQLRQNLSRLLDKITDTFYSLQFFLPPLQVDLGARSPWGGFRRQLEAIDGLIFEEIGDRRFAADLGDRSDILSLLMTAEDEQGQPLSDQELRDQLMTLLLLGHETTASALAWAFYWLHRQPETLAALRLELEGLGADADPMMVAEQPFLTAVCKEALRVYPIALISQPRRVKETVELEGYRFEPGTVLIPCIYTAQRRPRTYGEDVLAFRPERFLERKFGASEYFPFGGGARSCIGMALSMLEMKLALATVLRECRFEPVGDRRLRPQRRGITFVPPDASRLLRVK